ncbi:2Fe-2S iron-sulfur cluster-binding protein [Streptomyces sp. NPDC051776]|uniref:2Fe-2S iron-sulfur cluster-binding protein n=1 Tax=Streptomyces sp. NPDC051776 TaxID=3155414 RepID=UPI003430F859
MSSDQQPPSGSQGPHPQRGPHGWEPLPQGEYDSDTTAFVRLPDNLLDPSAVPPGADPLAAPGGHGYVPPSLTPESGASGSQGRSGGRGSDPSAPDDPRATGQWTMPFADTGAGQGGGWGDAGGAAAQGQWSVPIAPDDPVGESGEYLVEGRARPAAPYGGGRSAPDPQWYGQGGPEGEQGPTGLTQQWTFPPAGEQLPDSAVQSTPPSHSAGPGAQDTRGGHGRQGDWNAQAAPTGQWSVPTAGTPGTDESGTYRLDESTPARPQSSGGDTGSSPWQQSGSGTAVGRDTGTRGTSGGSTGTTSGGWTTERQPSGGPEQPRSARGGTGRRKLATGPGGAAAEARGEAADADTRGVRPRESGPWPTPAGGTELPGRAGGETRRKSGSGSGAAEEPAGDPSPAEPGGRQERQERTDGTGATGASSYAGTDTAPRPAPRPAAPRPPDGGSLPGRAAEDVINRLTGSMPSAANGFVTAPGVGAPASGNGTSNGAAPAGTDDGATQEGATQGGTTPGGTGSGRRSGRGARHGNGARPGTDDGTGKGTVSAPGDTGGEAPGRAAHRPATPAAPARDEAATPARDEAATPARHEAATPARHEAATPAGHEAATPAGHEAAQAPAGHEAAEARARDEAEATSAQDDAVDEHSEHPHASYVLSVNGTDRPVTDAWIGESLLYVLRERLGLAGAKDGCSQGECGACSVQVDGRLVASCLVPAATAAGSEVRTVEGLAADGVPSDVQRALASSGAVQCGFCVPGLAMTVHDLLEGNHAPTELETRQAICGNLCRCSGYRGILDAVREVVESRVDPADAEEDGEDTPRIPQQAGPYDGNGSAGGPA